MTADLHSAPRRAAWPRPIPGEVHPAFSPIARPLAATLMPEPVPQPRRRPAHMADPNTAIAIFLMALAAIGVVGAGLLAFALVHGWFA